MDTTDNKPKTVTTPKPTPASPDRTTLILRRVVAAVLGIIVLAGAWVLFLYATSPEAIRNPRTAHYHFRMQIINGGTPVDLSALPFQTPFNKDICDATLTKEPIHFHDQLDQFVHIHWDGMTGGLLLKHYGWNFLSGADDTLGYRFDDLPRLNRVPIHGQALPKPPADAKYYVYIGNTSTYKERTWDDFLRLNLRTFFESQPKPIAGSMLDRLIPSASAHSGHDHDTAGSKTQEELTLLNNVIGNVVIFVQKDAPTDAQIKDRFNHLIALPESSCGG